MAWGGSILGAIRTRLSGMMGRAGRKVSEPKPEPGLDWLEDPPAGHVFEWSEDAARDPRESSAAWGEPEPVRRTPVLSDDLGFGDWADSRLAKARSHPRDKRHVCGECLNDKGLAQFVDWHAEAKACDFCKRRFSTERAAPLSEVVRYIEGCLWQDYDQPENVLFYDPESESGFAGVTWQTWELLSEHLWIDDGDLFDAIVNGFDSDLWWCEADPATFLPNRELEVSWEVFCHYVKHTSRFMFTRPDEKGRRLFDEQDRSLVQSTEMLDLFGEVIDHCGLVTTLGVRTKLFRARKLAKGDAWFTSADDLGPAPATDTGPPASRMSPAGIPVTYAALDDATAVRESATTGGRIALGVFSPLRPLKVLDQRSDRPVPYSSIFENVRRMARGLPGFVEAFREEISRPVKRDGREHIDYVPSQIVTEYIRRVHRADGGDRLDGVLYPSTRVAGGVCVALFATPREIAGCSKCFEDEAILRFRPKSPKRLIATGRGSTLPGPRRSSRPNLVEDLSGQCRLILR